jgi:hypothetical protein
MNLLISELLPVDVELNRAIPWIEDLEDYLSSLAADYEISEHEGRITSSPDPAWYDLRTSMLRQAILDAY